MYQQRFCNQILGIGLGLLISSPLSVFAQVVQLPISISRNANENFDGFIQRATALTTSTLKSRFGQEKSLNQLRVVVIGENSGAVAPLLTVTMSRQQWLSNPHPEPLIHYFPDSKSLLGFDLPTAAPALANPQTPPSDLPATLDNSNQSPAPTSPEQPPAKPSPESQLPSLSPTPPPLPLLDNNSVNPPSEPAPTSSYGRFREATTQPPSP